MAVNPYDGAGYGCGIGYGYCGTPAAGSALLLDNLAATYGAWSVARQIRTAYSGPLIRVRESGGNTEADISAASGVLDEAALASHVGANSGYITKIYNQDSNGSTLDFAQSTTTIQPIIVESGTIVKENGKPAAKFVAASARRMSVPTSTALFKFLHDGTACTISAICKANNTAALKLLLSTQLSSYATPGSTIYSSAAEALQILIGNESSSVVQATKSGLLTSQSILSISIDADNATAADRESAWNNNTLLTGDNASTLAASAANCSGDLMIGARGDGASPWDGLVQELIIWPTDEAASRAVWEADMADFYGVVLA